jgi:hypothetical protein
MPTLCRHIQPLRTTQILVVLLIIYVTVGLDLPICYTYKDGHIRRKAEGPSIFSTGLANLFFNSKRKKFKNASHVKGLLLIFFLFQ